MGFDFTSLSNCKRQFPASNSVWVDNLLTQGQTQADKHLFAGLSCEFDVNVHGTKYNFIFYFQVDRKQN